MTFHLSERTICLCVKKIGYVTMVRHKNRYIILTVNESGKGSGDSLNLHPGSIHKAVLTKVQQLYGDFGVAAIRAGFSAKYCNEKTRVAIVRVRHGPHRFVASALPCITSLEKKYVQMNILYVGATIKHCFMFLQKYQLGKFEEFCVNLRTDEEKTALREAIMNFESGLENM